MKPTINCIIALLAIFCGLSLVECHHNKIDCHPLSGATEQKCQQAGCVWSPVKDSKQRDESLVLGSRFDWSAVVGGITPKPEVNEPWCYYPANYSVYKIHISDTGSSFKLIRNRPSTLPTDINELHGHIEFHGPVLRLKIYDPNQKRYEPEIPKLNLPIDDPSTSGYMVHLDQHGNLGIGRKNEVKFILQTQLQTLLFGNDLIQLNFMLSGSKVVGLGEHYDNFVKTTDDYKSYGFYHTDKLPLPGGRRSYGSFPFLVNIDDSNKTAHGLYLRNSNGMDIVLQPDKSVSFRTIGGVLDFYVFIGPTANDVVGQYQHLVGLPDLPPRWALGFHLCRYNYSSIENLRKVWQRTRDSGIPFDVQWTDIDTMNDGNDFTHDPEQFKGLPQFVDELHKLNMHYVPILDPGLSQEANYEPYQLGVDMDAFIKNATNQILVGKVWNKSGRTVFPDFSSPKGKELWKILFQKFHEQIKFDGAWIDMNEISNFVDGSLDGCPDGDDTLYKPGGYDLKTKTLCPSAKHKAGSEYDVHNLFSFYEAIATSEALKAVRPNKRPFVISRASSPGQGHYSGHWSGDVLSTWDYLRYSIVASIEHSMYGFNMMGSDICGFTGDTNEELCARWSTLGAFYTFSRNHNDEVSIEQDPVAMGPHVLEATRNALTMRYSLLPYLYTLIHRAHRFGEPVVRSTFLEYYQTDPAAFDAEHQFLWGSNMIVAPIVNQGCNVKQTYLPKGRWFEFNVLPLKQGETVRVPKIIESQGSWFDTVNITLEDIPIFFKSGSIIPVYRDVKQTVPETVNQPFGLDVMNSDTNMASGELFVDDGESLDDKFNHIIMTFDGKELKIEMQQDLFEPTTEFGKVNVYAVQGKVTSVKVNGVPILFTVKNDNILSFDLARRSVSKQTPLVVEISSDKGFHQRSSL